MLLKFIVGPKFVFLVVYYPHFIKIVRDVSPWKKLDNVTPCPRPITSLPCPPPVCSNIVINYPTTP